MGRPPRLKPAPRPATLATPGAGATSAREAALVAALAAALAVAVCRGGLAYGFSQDDFLSLARVRGLAPRLEGPWRIVANQWFWDAGVRLFGLDARPFHLFALALHAAASALLAWLLARRLPAPAALLAACAYATHPAHATALWWASATGDPAMALLLLLATAAWFSRGAWRWLAVPAFTLALAWKESALLFPLALLAIATLGPGARRDARAVARDPVLIALAVVALAWAAGIASFVRGLSVAGNAYEPSPAAMGRNLLAYASWIPAPLGWLLRDASDDARPAFVATGAIVLALMLSLLAWRRWRARGAAGALVAELLLLAPVLPLGSHTYRYYLCAPLLAGASALAALFAAATERRSPGAAWAAAALIVTLLVASNAAWLLRLEHAPFLHEGSRADRTLDRALIAEHALADARASAPAPGTRLAMWSPQAQAEARERGGDPALESYDERNVRAALLDGLALRVMVPAIDSVAFVRAFTPLPPSWRWGVYRWDGHLRVVTSEELARVLADAPR